MYIYNFRIYITTFIYIYINMYVILREGHTKCSNPTEVINFMEKVFLPYKFYFANDHDFFCFSLSLHFLLFHSFFIGFAC